MFGPKTYADEDLAREAMEAIRWPNGPVCHHCESKKHYATKKAGRYRCANPKCRKDFTVTTGTVMERSHIPLRKWVEGFAIMCESKKGVSSLQLQRHLKISYKAAWFMSHRIREAMREGGMEPPPMLGGGGKIVEADETYFGKPEEVYVSPQRRGRPFIHKGKFKNSRPIVSLVERGGRVRSFHVASADQDNVTKIVRDNIDHESRLHTDESRLYSRMSEEVAKHETVRHAINEYARGDVTTNSVEGFFGIFKRGMRGVYQHCKEKHLHRYLAEFDFRYNHRVAMGVGDGVRALLAIRGAEGKRLTYRQAH